MHSFHARRLSLYACGQGDATSFTGFDMNLSEHGTGAGTKALQRMTWAPKRLAFKALPCMPSMRTSTLIVARHRWVLR